MPTASPRSPRIRALAAACALVVIATACGDDDDTEATAADETTSTSAVEGDTASIEEYCAAVAELDQQDGPPTAEQMEDLKQIRPEEIGEDVDHVADALIAADGDMGAVFSDPEVEERLGRVEEFEAENCDAELAVAPEVQEYCAVVEEMDSQAGPPTEEQLLEAKELAPDAVAGDVAIVADAFVAAGGDVGQMFSDPAVEEALGRVEEHDAEACGIGGGGGEDEEVATEPLEGAEVVEVTAVDFAFEGVPATVPAGDVSFHMVNEGEAAHEMYMARLGEGVDLDALLASDEEPSPEEAEEIGGTFAPRGESAYLNAEGLEPGTYAVVCFIPGPEGKAHHELGMKTTFQVG